MPPGWGLIHQILKYNTDDSKKFSTAPFKPSNRQITTIMLEGNVLLR
jgi:hypothetical protein